MLHPNGLTDLILTWNQDLRDRWWNIIKNSVGEIEPCRPSRTPQGHQLCLRADHVTTLLFIPLIVGVWTLNTLTVIEPPELPSQVKTRYLQTYSVSQNKIPPNVLFFSGKSEKSIPKYYRLLNSMVHWPAKEFWIFQFDLDQAINIYTSILLEYSNFAYKVRLI